MDNQAIEAMARAAYKIPKETKVDCTYVGFDSWGYYEFLVAWDNKHTTIKVNHGIVYETDI